jgi:hypothetical protein
VPVVLDFTSQLLVPSGIPLASVICSVAVSSEGASMLTPEVVQITSDSVVQVDVPAAGIVAPRWVAGMVSCTVDQSAMPVTAPSSSHGRVRV